MDVATVTSQVGYETGSGERGVGLKQPSVKTLTHHEALSSLSSFPDSDGTKISTTHN